MIEIEQFVDSLPHFEFAKLQDLLKNIDFSEQTMTKAVAKATAKTTPVSKLDKVVSQMTKCQQEKTVYGGLADWQTPVKIQVKFDANVLAPVMKTPVIKVDYKLKTEAKSEEKPAMIAALTSQNLSNFLDNSKSTDDSDSESGDEFIEGSELDEKDFCGRVDAADEESEDDADDDSFSSDEEDLAFITPPPLLQRQNAVVYRSFEMRPFAG